MIDGTLGIVQAILLIVLGAQLVRLGWCDWKNRTITSAKLTYFKLGGKQIDRAAFLELFFSYILIISTVIVSYYTTSSSVGHLYATGLLELDLVMFALYVPIALFLKRIVSQADIILFPVIWLTAGLYVVQGMFLFVVFTICGLIIGSGFRLSGKRGKNYWQGQNVPLVTFIALNYFFVLALQLLA